MTDWTTVTVFLVGAVAGAAVVGLALRQRGTSPGSVGRAEPTASSGRGAIEVTCSVCRKALAFTQDDLVKLSGPEMALAVRIDPNVQGKPLAEYVCPYCEAAHCFDVSRSRPRWVGANLYEPQTQSAHCLECGKPLLTPPWGREEYDGRLEEAPQLGPDLGLVCPFCKAVCCVRCCRKATRKRTQDGSLMCPRCSRHPIDKVFHP